MRTEISKDKLPTEFTEQLFGELLSPYLSSEVGGLTQYTIGNLRVLDYRPDNTIIFETAGTHQTSTIKIGNALLLKMWEDEDSIYIQMPKGGLESLTAMDVLRLFGLLTPGKTPPAHTPDDINVPEIPRPEKVSRPKITWDSQEGNVNE